MSNPPRALRALVLLLSLCLACNGCTSLHSVALPTQADATMLQDVDPGDRVEITLKSGEVRKFRVKALTTDAIVGPDQSVALADIASLSVRKVSGAKVTAIVVGTVVVLVGILYAAVAQIAKNSD